MKKKTKKKQKLDEEAEDEEARSHLRWVFFGSDRRSEDHEKALLKFHKNAKLIYAGFLVMIDGILGAG